MDQPDIIDLMIFGIVRGFFSLPVIVLAATPVFIASRLSKDVRWRQRLAWPLALACTMVAMIVDAVLGNNPLDFSLVPYGLWAWILTRTFRHGAAAAKSPSSSASG